MEIIRNLRNTSIDLFAKVIEETPDYVENTLLPFLRHRIRKTDSKPLEKGPLKHQRFLRYRHPSMLTSSPLGHSGSMLAVEILFTSPLSLKI